MKTYVAKKSDITKKWYLIDVKGKIVGRVATRIASILRGKHKVIFTPHVDVGDGVIVINADKIRISGKKNLEKLYKRYSGYPSGLKLETFQTVLQKDPTRILKNAVKGMLPKNKLGRKMIKKFKVYAGEKHDQKAQMPTELKV